MALTYFSPQTIAWYNADLCSVAIKDKAQWNFSIEVQTFHGRKCIWNQLIFQSNGHQDEMSYFTLPCWYDAPCARQASFDSLTGLDIVLIAWSHSNWKGNDAVSLWTAGV